MEIGDIVTLRENERCLCSSRESDPRLRAPQRGDFGVVTHVFNEGPGRDAMSAWVDFGFLGKYCILNRYRSKDIWHEVLEIVGHFDTSGRQFWEPIKTAPRIVPELNRQRAIRLA